MKNTSILLNDIGQAQIVQLFQERNALKQQLAIARQERDEIEEFLAQEINRNRILQEQVQQMKEIIVSKECIHAIIYR